MNGWTGRWYTERWMHRWWLSGSAPVVEIGRLLASAARLMWRGITSRLAWRGEVKKLGD